MKKVGLAVCYDTKNFGSQLQILATMKAIEKEGFAPEIIIYKKKLTPAFVLQTIPRLFNPIFLRTKLSRTKSSASKEARAKISIRNKRFISFIDEFFMNKSHVYSGWEKLVVESNKNYDIFLSGSDQLWLPSNRGSHFYTLEFANKEKKKVAYATSFGVSSIPWFQKKTTARYLSEFTYLSTRERSGQSIIKELTGRDSEVVCDPTLLFDKDEWMQFVEDGTVVEGKYIFAYFLGTNTKYRKEAEKLSKETGLKIVSCPFLDEYIEYDESFGDVQKFDVDSKDFVNLIRHASYVVTDSFHGSVFSIINHKKFMTFNRFTVGANSRNSRIDTLCEITGLASRRFNGDVLQILKDIDYDKVDLKLGKIRNQSWRYLSNSLKK